MQKEKKAKKIKLANGTIKPIDVKVGYKDAPKIFVDPKKVKVTTSIIRFPFEKENQ